MIAGFSFVYYFEELGAHTHVSMYCARADATLALCGDLIMRNEEFIVFRTTCELVGFEFKPRERGIQNGCF